MALKIAFAGLEKEADSQTLKKAFPKAEYPDSVAKIKDKKGVQVLSGFVNLPVGKKEIALLPNLKYIITQSTGFDHIDLKECKKKEIKVYNIPDYGTETVSEYAMLLALALLRNLRQCESVLKEQIDIVHSELLGQDAFEKTLGVVGTGRIGANLIRIASGFGMKIIAYNHNKIPELEKKYRVRFVSLNELLKKSDIVSLHLPLTKETYHLIGKNAIGKMKKGAFIVNTARGGLVDVVALATALRAGKLGGAALDVVESEDLIAHEGDILRKKMDHEKLRRAFVGNMLLEMPNVILTPHIAYNTRDALRRIAEKTILTIKELEKGKERLYNLVS